MKKSLHRKTQFQRSILIVLLAGWLLLPAVSISSQQEPPSDPNFTVHVVQRGENLFRIALSYGLTTEAVALANGITNPGNIQVGQRLIIPIGGVPISEQQQPLQHIVQPGETLRSIADAYGLTTEELAARNTITDPNTIYVGQVLLIEMAVAGMAIMPDVSEAVNPDVENPVTAPENAVVDSPPALAPGVTHVVQSGETLFRIATQYGKSVDELQQANNITDATLIYAGQELIIPGVEAPQVAADLPDGVTGLSINPTFFTEGRTGRVLLTTAMPAAVTGSFLDRDLVVITDPAATSHIMLIGVPVYTTANIYPLALTITPNEGAPITVSANIQVLAGNYGFQRITLPDDRIELLSMAVEENEINVIRAITSGFNAQRHFDGPMSLPAAAAMNGAFGAQRSYNGGPFDRYHNGADFAGAPGSPILAAAPGQVVMADTLNIRGLSIIIDHGWGVYTNYSHMTERLVQLGDFVTTGQVIGTVGNTGRATGAHLHWELWVNGVSVDPMQWVSQTFP